MDSRALCGQGHLQGEDGKDLQAGCEGWNARSWGSSEWTCPSLEDLGSTDQGSVVCSFLCVAYSFHCAVVKDDLDSLQEAYLALEDWECPRKEADGLAVVQTPVDLAE